MHLTKATPILGLLAVALGAPGVALAYNEQDAIRDCENRIRSEHGVSDLRNATAERLDDVALHFMVQGRAKVDGQQYPWNCEVKNRHVTSAEYDGPKPEGLGTAEGLAIGAAAAIAAGIAISEASKHGSRNHASAGGSGARSLQDLVGARASSGESQLEERGYTFIATSKGGDSAYSTWRKGSHCVTARTVNGHYKSIVDVTMADCQ